MGSERATDDRWQGYSHRELFDMLNSGPGSPAAGTVADRWSGMSNALADIQSEINSGVSASGATWVGDAGETARGALTPLGAWARQASSAADMMRISTELQGDLLGKARSAMPAPIPVAPQPGSGGMGLAQLMSAQLDHEISELASHAVEQQAFAVMAQYEAGTNDNTGTLGEFGQPPTVVLDTAPIAAATPRRPAAVAEPGRRGAGYRVARTTSPDSAAASRSARRGPSRTVPAPTTPGAGAGDAATRPGAEARPTVAGESGPSRGAPSTPTEPVGPSTTTSAASPPTATPARPAPAAGGPAPANAHPVTAVPRTTGPTDRDTNRSPDRTPGPTAAQPRSGHLTGSTVASAVEGPRSAPAAGPAPAQPAGAPLGTAVGPNSNRADHADDETHESKYLLDAEDIYGDQHTFSPPVIGENRPRR